MKLRFIPYLLLTLVACRKEEDISDKLTPAEREALQQRASAKCLAVNGKNYEDYKGVSAGVFSSNSYKRNRGWLWTFKKGDATTETQDIRVWKRDPTEIYFYVTEKIGSRTNNFFLKLSIPQNDDIIDDLKADHCATDSIYKSKASGSALSISYTYTRTVTNGSEEYTDAYAPQFNELPYFAKYHLTRTVVIKDVDGKETGKESYSSTLTAQTYEDDLLPSYTSYDSKFCYVVPTDSLYRFVSSEGESGFSLACDSSLPAGWSL